MPKRKRDVTDVAAERQRFAAGFLFVPESGLAMVRETEGDRTGLVLPTLAKEKHGTRGWRETAQEAVLGATGLRAKVSFNAGSLARKHAQGDTSVTVFLLDSPEKTDLPPSEKLVFVPFDLRGDTEPHIDPDTLLYPEDAQLIDQRLALLGAARALSVGTHRAV